MTNGFASRIVGSAAAAVLACLLTTSVGAQDPQQPDATKTMVLFFDMQSATLSPEARTIVLSAVDAAERSHAGHIELAAYAAPDESARDPGLAARRAAVVKALIADYGFRGLVFIDEEAPELPLVAAGGDRTFDRLAVLRVGG